MNDNWVYGVLSMTSFLGLLLIGFSFSDLDERACQIQKFTNESQTLDYCSTETRILFSPIMLGVLGFTLMVAPIIMMNSIYRNEQEEKRK